MANCKDKYTSKHFTQVANKLLRGIRKNNIDLSFLSDFADNDAILLKEGIERLIGTGSEEELQRAKGILLGQIPEIEGAFGPQFLTTLDVSTKDSNTIEIENVPKREQRTALSSVRGSFLANKTIKDPTVSYNNAINSFRKRIVESAIYDINEKRLLNSGYVDPISGLDTVNLALTNYRLELAKSLWEILYPDTEFSYDFKSDIDFTNRINKILNAYQTRSSEADPSGDKFGTYLLLKNFDSLLSSEFRGLFEIKQKYKNNGRLAEDMYTYTGGTINVTSLYGDEYADASDYSGKLVKIMLDYLTVNGRSIGFGTFSYLMSMVREWAEIEGGNTITRATNDDGVRLSASEIVFGDNNSDWAALIDAFIDNNRISITTEEKESLEAIRDNLMKSADDELRSLFVNQAKKTIKYRYLAVMPRYNPATGRTEMMSVELSDRLIDRQNFNVQKSIQNSVFNLRRNPDVRTKLLKDNDIVVDTSGDNTIVTFKNVIDSAVPGTSKDVSFEIKSVRKGNNINSPMIIQINPIGQIYDKINTDKVALMVRQLIGLPLPNDIEEFINQYNSQLGVRTLLDVFYKPLIHTIIASDSNYAEIDDWKREYSFKNGIISTLKYFSDFSAAAALATKLYSTTDNNVIRNEDGNALPGYQITSAIFEVKQNIYDMRHNSILRSGLDYSKTKSHDMFIENPLFRIHRNPIGGTVKKTPIGRIFTRGAITQNGYSKESNALSSKEVFHSEITNNFLKRLTSTEDSIILQPITFSDKKTHFLIEYNIAYMWTKYGRNYKEMMKDMIDSDKGTRDVAKEQILREIREVRGDRAKRQIINVLNRFNKVYKLWDETITIGIDNQNLKSKIDLVRNQLAKETDISKLRDKFEGVDLDENLDLSVWKVKKQQFFDLNYTLLQEVENYLFDEIAFSEYFNEQKRQFAKRLAKHKWQFDAFFDQGLTDTITSWESKFGKHASEWIDKTGKTMKAFRVLDSKGNEITDFDSPGQLDKLFNGDYNIELHPIVEAYMLSDALLSNSFNEIAFGTTNGFTDKGINDKDLVPLRVIDQNHFQKVNEIKAKKLDKNIEALQLAAEAARYRREKAVRFARATASRLGDEFKRTIIAGGIRTPYAQGLKYGVSDKWKVSVVARNKVKAYNYKGDTEDVAVHDGHGRVSPLVARQENVSLKDARTEGNIRKTLISYNDPETGTLREIKWAEGVITNADRRSSPTHSDWSAEHAYQDMHGAFDIEQDKLLQIELSDYYNPEGMLVLDGNRELTHTKYLYYKNRLNRKHYKILSVESDVDIYGNFQAKIKNIEVDSRGKEIGDAFYTTQIVNTIADFDKVFGGAYCEALNEETGNLEYVETNNDIVNTIVCDNSLKDYMIAYIIDDTSIKVGANNINPSDKFSRTNNSKLKYFEIETKHAGIQMNADHEIEESDVSEMGQMISALIQGGFSKREAEFIYRTIGKVALKNIRIYQKVSDSNDTEAMYEKLGKLFASAFVSGRRDSLSLAEAFITNAAEALKLGRKDSKIPFSSNQIKGIFQATVTSTLNKLGIRRKFPGLGGLNAPSFGVRQLYKIGDGFADADEAEDFIYNDLQQRGFNTKGWGIHNIFWKQRSSDAQSELDNPYISRLTNLDSILPEDTLVFREVDQNGTLIDPYADGKVTRIQDLQQNDLYKHLYKNLGNGIFEAKTKEGLKYYSIYKWDYQPRELRQSQDEVTVTQGDKSWTIFWNDLDTVRAVHYIANYDFDDPYKAEKDALIQSVLEIDRAWEPDKWNALVKAGELTKKQFDNLFSEFLNYANSRTQDIARTLQESGFVNVSITIDGKQNSVKLSNYKKHTAQIVMGRANAKLLGLQKGDKIRDIMQRGSDFFADRLRNKFQFPSDVDDKLYDMVLYGADGSKTLVVMSYVDSKYDRLDGCTVNEKYTINSDGNFEQDGNELFSVRDKSFYKTKDGKYDVLVVNNSQALREVLNSRAYSFNRYNYNLENTKALLAFENPDLFVQQGSKFIALTWFEVKGERFSAEDLTNLKPFELASLTKSLRDVEINKTVNKLEALAERRFQAFKAQLNYILTRIPAQSMQSFMDVEVAVYTDSEQNEVYVPRALQWIQGSDYDIDKDYMMGFGLAPDGTLPTLSDLEDDYDPMDVLLLEAPEGKKFSKQKGLYGIGKTKYDAIFGDEAKGIKGDISLLNDILRGSTLVTYKSIESSIDGLTENEINHLMNVLKKHESSVRTGNIEKLALQNTVVRNILRILKSPSVQLNMSNPISMREMQDIAKNSTLSKDELYMTLDVPFVKFDMQEQNMVGREVIGIGAVSLKHFFAASTYLNSRITVAERAAEKKDWKGMVEPLIDLVFNKKLGNHEIVTLGNLDFRRLKALLHKEKGDIVVLIDQDQYKSDANSYLFEPENGFVSDNALNITKLVEYLDKQSNGTSYIPVDVAFALSQLISAATDNAKELILAKLNATTKLADMYTYLLTTGMSFEAISKIMMSPEFNVVVDYAQDNIFEPITSGSNLENALEFVLDRKALPKNYKFDGFFNNILTEVWDPGAFLYKARGLQREFYNKTHDDDKASADEVLRYIQKVVNNKWDNVKRTYSSEYRELVKFIYEKIAEDPTIAQTLLEVLSERINPAEGSYIDPESLIDFGDIIDVAPEDLYEDMDSDEAARTYTIDSNGWSDMSNKDAVFVYRYVKDYLIPKNNKLKGILTPESKQRLTDILDKVLPAMQEQQIHGQLLGLNKGIPTDDYGEQNFIRKIEVFVNKRYYDADKTTGFDPEQFDFIKFLSDEIYRNKQIKLYEHVKSSINILKSITSVPHYWSMFSIVRINRNLISRSAALQIERDLSKSILGNENSSGQIKSGERYKLNAKEFKELQRVVSDALIAGFITSLDRNIMVPNGYSYYEDDGEEKVVMSDGHVRSLNNLHGLASFKRWIDDYVIPKLMRDNPKNEFLLNLTTGLKRDPFSKRPFTFYKPSFNLSDVSRSPKLALIYEGISKGFNEIYHKKFENSDWTIGDLFYLYNLMVNKDSIGGDSFTRLFEEMSAAKDRFSLIYQYNDWLSRIDTGDLRWTEAPSKVKQGKDVIAKFGDTLSINLSDIRYRCSVDESSDWKFNLGREKDKSGNTKYVYLREDPNRKIDLTKAERNDYVLNLPFSVNANFIAGKAVQLEPKAVSLNINTEELVRAVVDYIKDDLGGNVPIHYVSSDEIENIIKNPSDRLLNAKGFVYNGEIFINTSTIDPSTPMHELMHLVCAAMKYGNSDQRSLYYRLLDSIVMDESDPRWGEFYKAVVDADYNWAKGSDFKEEILVRALAHAFETNFEDLWKDREVDVANVQRIVTNLLEKMFIIDQTGTRQISEIISAPFGEILSIFRSQFIGEDVNKVVRLIMPDNQRIAAFKSRIYGTILTDNGNC